MAIGDSQDDSRVYGDNKHGIPLLQIPRNNSTGNIYAGHLPLAPAQNQYLDTRPETQHQFQTTITTPVDNIPSGFNGMSFSEPQERMHTPMRRQSRVNVTLTMYGLEDPSNMELEWSLSTGINAEQRSKIDRYVRKVLTSESDSRFNTPRGGASYNGSRRSSWAPDCRTATFGLLQAGSKRPAAYQLSRSNTPDEDDDEDGGYMSMIGVVPMIQIRLDDTAQIRAYYESILKGIQQLALKSILKEWIKEIEPKKQKNCPYKKGIRPKWWPETAAYKEPDHIKIEDRIILALGIIEHAQDLTQLEGEGLNKLEKSASKIDLKYENESTEKQKFREDLLKSLFALARVEQQAKNKERDSTESISLPLVKKFEKPNKKRKKNSDKSRSIDSDYSLKYEDSKPSNGLLNPGTLKSQGDRASSAPNTPSWSRHAAQDSGVCFPPNDQGHNPHLMPYSQSYEQSVPMERGYSSYDEGNMNGANSSPDSSYATTTTSAGSMHMGYPSVSMGYTAPIHGLTSLQCSDDSMSNMVMQNQNRPQVTQVYTAVTETEPRNWSATPASYISAQPQSFATTAGYY